MSVHLDYNEVRYVAREGIERRISAMSKRRRGAHGFDRDEVWDIDIEGLAAEYSVAKFLGLDYTPVVGQLDTAAGDVGPGLQVRSTKYDTGHLLIHNTDADTDRFILVTGRIPTFEVRGWVYASEAKKPDYWRCHGNRCAFWVPQSALKEMDELDIEEVAEADAA